MRGLLAVVGLALLVPTGLPIETQAQEGQPVPIEIYTPQMRNDMKKVIDATADLEKDLLPHFEKMKLQKEDYDAVCGAGATDENCQEKFAQMTDTYEGLLEVLEQGLDTMVTSIGAASTSYNRQFHKVARLRPSDVFDELSDSTRTSLTPAQPARNSSRRQLSKRIRALYLLMGKPGVSQAEQFIHSAADLSETSDLAQRLLARVRYQRLSIQANLVPAEFETEYQGLIPGIAALILGEDEPIPPPTEYRSEEEIQNWNDRLIR